MQAGIQSRVSIASRLGTQSGLCSNSDRDNGRCVPRFADADTRTLRLPERRFTGMILRGVWPQPILQVVRDTDGAERERLDHRMNLATIRPGYWGPRFGTVRKRGVGAANASFSIPGQSLGTLEALDFRHSNYVPKLTLAARGARAHKRD